MRFAIAVVVLFALTGVCRAGGPPLPPGFEHEAPGGGLFDDLVPNKPGAAQQPDLPPSADVRFASAVKEAYNRFRDRPELLRQVVATIRDHADAERAMEVGTEKAKAWVSDRVEVDVLKDTYSGSPKITAMQMLDNPNLTREAKERLLQFFPKPTTLAR